MSREQLQEGRREWNKRSSWAPESTAQWTKKLPAFLKFKVSGGEKDICSLWNIKTSLETSWVSREAELTWQCQESAGAKRAPLPICQTRSGTCHSCEAAKYPPRSCWCSGTDMNWVGVGEIVCGQKSEGFQTIWMLGAIFYWTVYGAQQCFT